MQRTTSARDGRAASRTTLLTLTTAASAALGLTMTGCVAVEPRRPPAPAPHSSPQSTPPATGPQIAQGPAREALGSPATPKDSARPRPADASPDRAPKAPRQRSADAERPRKQPPPPPRPAAPAPPAPLPDPCGLAESYGGWNPDSPQAGMCRDAYRP
ncbi:hypothetical protein [Streptomyces sp. NPDC047315]|uniref:hypothetical protein n=1 Tax=Streptomyces sp. NPDC047315 TaxID=3155142 RepID=UPI0033E6C0C7